MAKVGNRVKETSDTTGTGTLDLNGAATGFRSFLDEFTTGDEVYYLIVDDPDNPTDYEYGIGTITSGTPDTLSRDTVEGSSNSGNKVSWSAGTKTVICTPTAAFMESNVRQVVVATSTTDDTISTTSPSNTSLTGSITVRQADSRVIVVCSGRVNVRHDTSGGAAANRLGSCFLRRSSGTPADLANVAFGRTQSAGANQVANPFYAPLSLTGSEVPGAGSHTYIVRMQTNDTAVDAQLEGSTGGAATMILMEVAP